MPTLHVHLDESGNFHFNSKGSRFYIFATAWTYNPLPLATDLHALRLNLIKSSFARNGRDLDSFHASDDPAPRREVVLGVLLNHIDWNFASIVVEKAKVNPVLWVPEDFYPKFANMLLRFIFRGRLRRDTIRVLVYTDTLPLEGLKRGAVEGAIKRACNRDLNVPFESLHHRRESNAWLQVADYCAWAVCGKWEHNDPTAYIRLRPRLAARELEVTARGDGVRYY